MTRLNHSDISFIANELVSYDRTLFKKTGQNLLGLACLACNVSPEDFDPLTHECPVAVAPVTYGLGEITGFAQTVKAIVKHLGFPAFVTEAKDLAGLAESYASRAHILMLADDERFIAINLAQRRVVDNALATGRAYAAALNQMAGGLAGKQVLVIGCGQVGESAARALVENGAEVSLHDREHRLAQNLADRLETAGKAIEHLEEALCGHNLFLDASPAADLIQERHLTSQTFVAAPGVPHGVNAKALPKLGERFIHDPLQLGVAAMVVNACAPVGVRGNNQHTDKE